MAARRLLYALLVMLVVSSVAAALVPVDSDPGDETATEPPPAPPPGEPQGAIVERTVELGRAHPPSVHAKAGDRLVLTVKAKRFAEVEIPALGELADAEPATPAVFDLLLAESGRILVRLLGSGRRVATIVVEGRSGPGSEDDLDNDEGGTKDGESGADREAANER